MQEAKPVVLTKPVRGREMLSKKGPFNKAAEPEKVDKKKVETYYEGYVDGQLFLVPDSNLEAMKDMINFKMRPKTSIRYKHQTSYDIQYYDQFNEKLNELLSKIDDFQESGEFEGSVSMERGSSESTEELSSEDKGKDKKPEEEIEETISSKDKRKSELIQMESENKTISNESAKSKIEQVKSEIVEELEKEYVLVDNSLTSSSDSSLSYKLSDKLEEPEKEIKSQIYDETENDETQNDHADEKTQNECADERTNNESDDELRIRFLISGHFKDGEKPIYIVQEYNRKNDIFKDQKLDFISSQEKSNANVFISGKLYNENILVESEGKPSFLNTTSKKIMIDEEKSKIFNDSFEHVFEEENGCILLRGKFIKGANDKITPILSFSVTEKNISSNSECNKEEGLQKY